MLIDPDNMGTSFIKVIALEIITFSLCLVTMYYL